MSSRGDTEPARVPSARQLAWPTILLCSAMFVSLASAQQMGSTTLPAGRGLELIQTRCLSCHDMTLITAQRKSADEWITTIGVMTDRGAQLTPDEMQIVEDYLIQYLSSDAAARSELAPHSHTAP